MGADFGDDAAEILKSGLMKWGRLFIQYGDQKLENLITQIEDKSSTWQEKIKRSKAIENELKTMKSEFSPIAYIEDKRESAIDALQDVISKLNIKTEKFVLENGNFGLAYFVEDADEIVEMLDKWKDEREFCESLVSLDRPIEDIKAEVKKSMKESYEFQKALEKEIKKDIKEDLKTRAARVEKTQQKLKHERVQGVRTKDKVLTRENEIGSR